MSGPSNQPTIIKRKKVISGGGHHGGAWKVAYADFVTAMMAFFLLMWLLTATTDQQRAGIADYFSPSIPMSRMSGGGSGAMSGDSLQTKDTLSKSGTGGIANMEGGPGYFVEQAAETQALRDLESKLMGMGGESFLSDNAMRHVITRLTDEGLVIEVFDLPGAPLFRDDTDAPTQDTLDIAAMLSRVLALVTNRVAVAGHVKAGGHAAGVWDVSTGRAGRMRLLMEQAGLGQNRLARVTGKADREPAVSDAAAPRNNRLEIIVLRSDK